jgi:hypothetical protein
MSYSLKHLSLPYLLREYKQNKDIIDAYYGRSTVEGLDDKAVDGKVAGLTIGVFMLFLILSLVFFIWAVWLLVSRWSYVKGWVKVVGILTLLMGMPIITIILMYAGTQNVPVDRMRMHMCGMSHF